MIVSQPTVDLKNENVNMFWPMRNMRENHFCFFWLVGIQTSWLEISEQFLTITWMISSVQLLSLVQLFETPWTAARQASLSITNFQSLLKLMSIESLMPSNNLILCHPLSSFSSLLLLLLQSFSASGSFPMSQFFASGGQSIGVAASASVLPMNISDFL